MNNDTQKSVQGNVMAAIRSGGVRMKPRWQFMLYSGLAILGIIAVLLALLFMASLVVFFLRHTGAWFAPAFGIRGWFDFVGGVPWLLVALIACLAALLEYLMKRYAFVYKRPLLASIGGIAIIVLFGGFISASAVEPFHARMLFFADHGEAPPPLNFFYGRTSRPAPPDGLYRGMIVQSGDHRFVIIDRNRAGTTTVLVTPDTRLPYGGDFTVGKYVIVVGDRVGTDTLQAYGIQQIDPADGSSAQ